DSAQPLTVAGTHVNGAGFIETLGDADYFSFFTGAGQISLTVNVAPVGPNLDAKLELLTATGDLLATDDPSSTLGATITTTVATGSYRLVVLSHGTYGDLGQYSITGTVVPYLTVAINPTTISENAGSGAATGQVTRNNADLSSALTVTLSSSDTTEATVPTTV